MAGATSRGARFVVRQARRALAVRHAAREAAELRARWEAARARARAVAPAWPGVLATGTSTAPALAPPSTAASPAPAKG